jgi:hypothetical protein
MTLVVLAAGTRFYALLQSLVSQVLPEIQHHMHTSVGTVKMALGGKTCARATTFRSPAGRRMPCGTSPASLLAEITEPELAVPAALITSVASQSFATLTYAMALTNRGVA